MSDLSVTERSVLEAIAAEDDIYYPFKSIARMTGLDIDQVATACRSLRSKGLAAYRSGLMSEDGELCGSGYGSTPWGNDVLLTLRAVVGE